MGKYHRDIYYSSEELSSFSHCLEVNTSLFTITAQQKSKRLRNSYYVTLIFWTHTRKALLTLVIKKVLKLYDIV
jgi:hypothetical protein